MLSDEQIKDVTANIKKLADVRTQSMDDVDTVLRVCTSPRYPVLVLTRGQTTEESRRETSRFAREPCSSNCSRRTRRRTASRHSHACRDSIAFPVICSSIHYFSSEREKRHRLRSRSTSRGTGCDAEGVHCQRTGEAYRRERLIRNDQSSLRASSAVPSRSRKARTHLNHGNILGGGALALK